MPNLFWLTLFEFQPLSLTMEFFFSVLSTIKCLFAAWVSRSTSPAEGRTCAQHGLHEMLAIAEDNAPPLEAVLRMHRLDVQALQDGLAGLAGREAKERPMELASI
jgi:hypothetical protein